MFEFLKDDKHRKLWTIRPLRVKRKDFVQSNSFLLIGINLVLVTCFPILLITSYYVMYIAEYCNVQSTLQRKSLW